MSKPLEWEKVIDKWFGEGEPYVQFAENPPILDTKDIEQILATLNRPFDESKWEEITSRPL